MFECYEDFEKYISERLSKLRCEKGVSARDMSLTIGQGQGYIINIENKHNMPSMKGLYYICEYLKISPKDFFDDESRNPEQIQKAVEALKRLSKKDMDLIAGNIERLLEK